ncbi:MAG: choice-of-anchor B family protein [Gemmatimonadetes bacterium]|nr:choice-of-anchor B family protein [Gemmatimonadota bacterium]
MRTAPKFAFSFLALALGALPLTAQGFGAGVAIHSGQILVAEPGGPTSTGMVYVYEKTGDGWAETGTIVPNGAQEGGRFATWLAAYGDRMLVGSPGSAYVFERTDDGWNQTGTLMPTLPEGMTLGSAGAIAGDVALISVAGRRSRTGAPAGKVLAFERTADGWTEMGELASPESAANDGFGTSIITNGTIAAVGAPGASVSNTTRAGAVYFFGRDDSGAWTSMLEPLVAPDPSQGAAFGSAINARDTDGGAEFVVAAAGAGRGAGTVYSFRFEGEGAAPSLTSRFFPPVVGRRGGFGNALAFVGDELWIGGAGVGSGNEGQVLRYETSEAGTVRLADVLSASNAAIRDGFGARIAATEDVAVIVAGGKDNRYGTAYVYEREGDAWVEADEIWSEVQNYAAINGHEVGCEEGMSADFDCGKVNILSFMPISDVGGSRGERVNDVWGWTDPQTGREYALLGLTDQASFIDITDPSNPRYLGQLPMTEGANGSVWRDIKVFQNHAYIVSDGAGEHGMQVFDLERLRDVGSEPVVFDVDAHYDGIASAHNIVINEASGYAYSVGSSGGGETCGGGLHIIDINEPKSPTFIGCFADASTGRRNTGYSHDAQCIEYDGPDTEHVGKEICFGSNETAISIADVTDKENPIALSTASYPDVAYAHQGWVTEDHRYFYLGDELDELRTQFSGTRTMIFDITDLDDPVLVKEHFGESTASDHNMYVLGNLLYQSNYNSGMRILDITDPENPTEVGFLDTVPYAEGPSMGGSWSNYPYFASGTIIVTSGNEGLFMVRYDKPELVP